MTTLHLVHGFIGAGKTTFARALERTLPAMRFTSDAWMLTLYGADPPAEHYADFDRRIKTLMEEQWTRLLTLGLDVVLDGGFWARAERDATRAKAAELGVAVRLYRLHVSDAVALERVRRRNEGEAHVFIADNTFHVLRERFEELGPDEARIEVSLC